MTHPRLGLRRRTAERPRELSRPEDGVIAESPHAIDGLEYRALCVAFFNTEPHSVVQRSRADEARSAIVRAPQPNEQRRDVRFVERCAVKISDCLLYTSPSPRDS